MDEAIDEVQLSRAQRAFGAGLDVTGVTGDANPPEASAFAAAAHATAADPAATFYSISDAERLALHAAGAAASSAAEQRNGAELPPQPQHLSPSPPHRGQTQSTGGHVTGPEGRGAYAHVESFYSGLPRPVHQPHALAIGDEAADQGGLGAPQYGSRRRLKGGGGTASSSKVEWRNPLIGSFDNFGSTMLMLYIMSTGDGWDMAMYTMMDSTGVDVAPHRNDSSGACIFAIAWMFVGYAPPAQTHCIRLNAHACHTRSSSFC